MNRAGVNFELVERLAECEERLDLPQDVMIEADRLRQQLRPYEPRVTLKR
jgi:hypothetical protein